MINNTEENLFLKNKCLTCTPSSSSNCINVHCGTDRPKVKKGKKTEKNEKIELGEIRRKSQKFNDLSALVENFVIYHCFSLNNTMNNLDANNVDFKRSFFSCLSKFTRKIFFNLQNLCFVNPVHQAYILIRHLLQTQIMNAYMQKANLRNVKILGNGISEKLSKLNEKYEEDVMEAREERIEAARFNKLHNSSDCSHKPAKLCNKVYNILISSTPYDKASRLYGKEVKKISEKKKTKKKQIKNMCDYAVKGERQAKKESKKETEKKKEKKEKEYNFWREDIMDNNIVLHYDNTNDYVSSNSGNGYSKSSSNTSDSTYTNNECCVDCTNTDKRSFRKNKEIKFSKNFNEFEFTEKYVHQKFNMSDNTKKWLHKEMFYKAKKKIKRVSLKKVLLSVFPIYMALKTYKFSAFLFYDIAAGISEGIMAVPMGMSYALLAHMPAHHGLFNGIFFPLVYTVFGTSHYVSLGVSAIEALLTAEAVSRIVGWNAAESTRVDVTIGMCICTGIVYIIMRILGLGIIANFIADPVLSGFSSASAFIIAFSQLKHFCGIEIPKEIEISNFKLLRGFWYVLSHIYEWNFVTISFGIMAILLLFLFKKINNEYFSQHPLPSHFFIVVFFTLITYVTKLGEENSHIKVIGYIPNNFPSFFVPSFAIDKNYTDSEGNVHVTKTSAFLDMFREAIPIAGMFYIIHVSIAKTAANKAIKNNMNSEQELLALGLVNICGGFFQCFPCATSLSRTCIVSSMGVKTIFHNIPYSLVLVITIWTITPALYYLPYAVLASIVLFGVYKMIDFIEAIRLFKLGGADGLLWIISFITTIIFGAMEGIIISITLSLIWLIKKSARPSSAILGYLPYTNIYRNVKRFPMAIEFYGIRIFRFDSSLNFANASYFESKVMQLDFENICVLIIDGSSINDLDITSISMLKRLSEFFKTLNIVLLLANWKGPMKDFLDRANFYQIFSPDRCFLSLHDAVFWARSACVEKRRSKDLVMESVNYSEDYLQTLRDEKIDEVYGCDNLNNSSLAPCAMLSTDTLSQSTAGKSTNTTLDSALLNDDGKNNFGEFSKNHIFTRASAVTTELEIKKKIKYEAENKKQTNLETSNLKPHEKFRDCMVKRLSTYRGTKREMESAKNRYDEKKYLLAQENITCCAHYSNENETEVPSYCKRAKNGNVAGDNFDCEDIKESLLNYKSTLSKSLQKKEIKRAYANNKRSIFLIQKEKKPLKEINSKVHSKSAAKYKYCNPKKTNYCIKKKIWTFQKKLGKEIKYKILAKIKKQRCFLTLTNKNNYCWINLLISSTIRNKNINYSINMPWNKNYNELCRFLNKLYFDSENSRSITISHDRSNYYTNLKKKQ